MSILHLLIVFLTKRVTFETVKSKQMKKFTLIIALLFGFIAQAQMDTVTFRVDLNNYTGTFTSAYVNSTFNAWCGACNPMTDADNDGVWEVALPLSPGSIEYKFTLDGWTAQESLTPGTPCTVTVGPNTNRTLTVAGDTVLPVVCWNSCGACSNLTPIDLPIDWEGTTVDYTVTDFGGDSSTVVVDPTNSSNMVLRTVKKSNAQTWAGTTLSTPAGLASAIPFAAGSTTMTIDIWSPDAGIQVRLKAEDASDPTKSVETEATTTVANGWQTLTFDFANQAAGTAAINFGYTYNMVSIFYNFGVDGNTAGQKTYYCDNVQFGGSTPPAGTSNVTFRLDMNNYSGSFTTPEVNGEFNTWCGNCTPMSDADNDGVWEVTVPITLDSTEFKYSFDNWAGQETLIPGLPCTKTTGNFTNRIIHLSGDTVLDVVCWESCSDCASAPQNVDVTFKIDMSTYTGSYSTVNVNGTFNNWCGSCTQLTSPNNDSIYEITVTMPADSVEYKFTLDGWNVQESLTAGSTCTITTNDPNGTFTNRLAVVSSDTALSLVCWEQCLNCDGLSTTDFNWVNYMTVSPNPSNGVLQLEASLNSSVPVLIEVLDLQGRVVYNANDYGSSLHHQMNLSNLESGLYFIRISSELGGQMEKFQIIR